MSLEIKESPASAGLLLFAFFAVALFVRAWFAWDPVFGGSFVRFSETDAWYHVRLVENLLHHFPASIVYDPYLKFPTGENIQVAPGFDLLIAAIALIVGAGSPSVATIERVAAITPAVLGALTIFPVYLLTRSLFNRRAGLFAAAIAAIMPGQFLTRTTVGYADHHAAEILLSTLALAWLARALIYRTALQRWRPWILAGTGLAAYLAVWSGGGLLVFAMTLGVAAVVISAHLQGEARDRSVWGFVLMLATSLVLVVLLLGRFFFAFYHEAALVSGILAIAGLIALSRFLTRWPQLRLMFPLIAAAIVIAAGVISYQMAPEYGYVIRSQVARLTHPGIVLVGETVPLFEAEPTWIRFLILSFGLTLPLALFALVPTLYAIVVERRRSGVIVLAWLVVSTLAMVGQVRFSYYVAVPVAVLAGLACDWVLARFPARQNPVFLGLVVTIFLPLAMFAHAQAAQPAEPSDDWHEALTWVRHNTPEAFGDAGAYFDAYAGATEERPYPRMASAYGVLSWWDVGHWIVRIARRPANSDPTQSNVTEAAGFFLATDSTEANAWLDRLKTRYVIVSSDTAAWSEPFLGVPSEQLRDMAIAAGRDPRRYYETVYDRTGSVRQWRVLYYPDYYQTMSTRLYVYGGAAAVPRGPVYVAFFAAEQNTPRQDALRELRTTSSYQEAERVVRDNPGARIVSLDPFETCVPLDALTEMSLVHRTPTTDARTPSGPGAPTLVQVYEYRAAGPR